jgi:Uma2 family endonuclease
MGDAAQQLKMTPEEYLAFERASDTKHEYVNGKIVARPPSTHEHSLIATNIVAELNNALIERPCNAHGSDMKVKSAGKPNYHYPDGSVVCGKPMLEDEARDTLLNPKLVVEVLSDSTERYDRGDKFASYRTIGTLEEYVLVSQTSVLVEHYHRATDGTWIYRALGPGERLVLPSLGCEIPVDHIYLKVFSEE